MDRVSVPLWGTFLSEPLDIVGTVGRYPAVYLMSREPIRDHQGFQWETMRPPILWGVRRRFRRLSPGHGRVAHALRTLSPVAANRIATTALPLDLHVLSLPLAFILSQDQTLLCIYTILLSVRSRQILFSRNQRSRFKIILGTCLYYLSIFSKILRSLKIPTPSLPLQGGRSAPFGAPAMPAFRKESSKNVALQSEAGCKGNNFFFLHKLFCGFF